MTRVLILASQSPRRSELLKLAGYAFRQVSVQLSEIPDENLNPAERIRQLAYAKAKACLEMRIPSEIKDFGLVSADTLVVLGDKTLGKPKGEQEACQMLRQLSGKTHQVITSVVIYDSTTERFYAGEGVTHVTFRVLSDADIQEYVATGDPFDKAGAYGIQGYASRFVNSIQGDFDNVVGFPMQIFEQLRANAGIEFERSLFALEVMSTRLSDIRSQISVAVENTGRTRAAKTSQGVRLIAVSKTKPIEAVVNALRSGQLVFGENYVQEAVVKQQEVQAALRLLGRTDLKPEWHFIGQLQTNKVKEVVGKFDLIHSVDRFKLAEAISKRSVEKGVTTRILIQVNVAGEETKGGTSMDQAVSLVQDAMKLRHVVVAGLMCMPPLDGSAAMHFQRTRKLFESIRAQMKDDEKKQYFSELSMGTTHDFVEAIQEGSTLIRVGTAIFGERT